MYLQYKTTYYKIVLAYKCYNDGYESLCAFLHNSNGRLELRYYSDFLAYISFFYYRLYMFLY